MKKSNKLKSMTGFGEGRFSTGDKDYRISISSVNHKFLDISVRLPEEMSVIEAQIKKFIRAKLKRGRVSVVVERSRGGDDLEVEINTLTAKKYVDCLRNLSKDLPLEKKIDPVGLLSLPGVAAAFRSKTDPEKFYASLMPCLKKALAAFLAMREAEADNLKKDISSCLNLISSSCARIEKRAAADRSKKSARLKTKISEAGFNPSDGAFASEVVNLLNRLDINEEIVRLNSHIGQFSKTLSERPSGIKLEFILQEMLRESNTIASKSQDISITNRTIEIKTELQKLREQVQNIE